MQPICRMMAILPVLAGAALAQNTQQVQVKLVQQLEKLRLAASGAVMGPIVKGAPYSGIEITDHTQTLGDGNRIHNNSQAMVYRDSEGRTRRETPDQITIWDPVADTSYVLDPKAQTARKLPLGKAFYTFSSAGHGGAAATAQLAMGVAGGLVVSSGPLPPPGAVQLSATRAIVSGPNIAYSTSATADAPKPQSLGDQVIEGVKAQGTRTTSTIEAGAIGNDRPIQMVSETWYSPDLQTVIKSTHSDPRIGDDSFQLTNISRTEPAAYLFQVPSGYQIVEPEALPPLPKLPK